MSEFDDLRKHETTAHVKETNKLGERRTMAARFPRGKSPNFPCIALGQIQKESNLVFLFFLRSSIGGGSVM